MSLITTNQNRVVIKKAESMMLVPYVYDSTLCDYILGGDVYDISAIIGDTITIEQSDGNVETKYNEFVGSPLLNAFHSTKYSFSAQCLDFQDKAIRPLFDAMIGNLAQRDEFVAFNDDFMPLYVLIKISLKGTSLPDIYLPKVQLNTKLFINQLKSRAAQANISGIALPRNCAIIQSRQAVAVGLSRMNSNINNYTPFTPVIFTRSSVVVLHHKGKANVDIFSSVNYNNGNVSHTTGVNVLSGAVTNIQPD